VSRSNRKVCIATDLTRVSPVSRPRSGPLPCGLVEILASRAILRPADPATAVAFYRDTLGLAISREFPGGTVFFLGSGFLEVSASPSGAPDGDPGTDPGGLRLWLQVRDLAATYAELSAAGVAVLREPKQEPWGLHEMWVADPDGTRIVFVEVPPEHPIRRDTRGDRAGQTAGTGSGAGGPA